MLRGRLPWILISIAFSVLSSLLDLDGERRPSPIPGPNPSPALSPALGPTPHAPSTPGVEIRARAAIDPSTVSVQPAPIWRFGAGGKATRSVGTAFSIAPGVWISAKHVTEGCDAVVILDQADEDRHQVALRVVEHPYADAALIETERSGQPLPLSITDAVLDRAEPGYHFGFPSGDPGQARSLLIGASSAQTGSRGRRFPIWVWSEQARYPNARELGGISGGPAFDDTGAAVGITIGGNPRRGRIATTAPQTTIDLIGQAGRTEAVARAASNASPVTGITQTNYIETGDRLRQEERVAQVYCHVE